jgi:ATP citrate (pro-S)-lyase
MLVLLGEVGGVEEYRVVEAVKKGMSFHPVILLSVDIVI